ncbi:hypothetical protein ACFL3G_07750 [Planctomycetota bacterium]
MRRLPRFVFCVFLVTAVSATSWAEVDLRFGVSNVLPVVGAEQVLVARIGYSGSVAREATVSFHNYTKAGEQIGPVHQVKLTPGGKEIVVRQNWVPQETGEYVLMVQFDPGEGWRSYSRGATQTVTVVKRQLHFHSWGMSPLSKYLTEGMVGRDRSEAEYWTDRGVLAQHWKGGRCYNHADNLQSKEDLVDVWTEAYKRGYPGIVIDEIGGLGDISDEHLCQGVIWTNEAEPNLYIAAYVVKVVSEKMGQGLREGADRVLMECPERNASRGYSRITSRYDSTVKYGMADKALVSLYITPYGATTPQEVRRQIHFTRYTYPEMPGIAFYGGSYLTMTKVYNKLIEQYYIGPVLRCEASESGRLVVKNIGGMDAPLMQVKFRRDDGSMVSQKIKVPALAVDESYSVELSGKDPQVVTEYVNGCLVLGPPLLWDKEPAEFRPNATAKWPAEGKMIASVEEKFNSKGKLEIEYDKSGKEGYEGNISGGFYSIKQIELQACEMQFEVRVLDGNTAGAIEIGMSEKEGSSLLNLQFNRSGKNSEIYCTVSIDITEKSPLSAVERVALVIEADKVYQMKVRYEPAGYVRLAILDEGGGKLWDTGEVPTYGAATFDSVRFGVSSGQGSEIQWDAKQKSMRLVGASKPGDILAGYVDNIKVSSFKR